MLNITNLPQFTRNAARFKEIVSVLVRYGLANWMKEGYPDFIKGLLKSKEGERIVEMSHEARVRAALSDLGPTFIKLGQILSTRPDLVGPDLAEELAKLQSDSPADPAETVRALLEAELGQPVQSLFSEFGDEALASGSIGQVHAAKLDDGTSVVVKVQHDGIEKTVATDLDILAGLAELAEKYDPELKLYQPSAMVAEFSRTLLRELDFQREERNLQRFTRNFGEEQGIRVPKPYPERSSRRVLTMERLEGFSIGDTERLNREGIDTKELAQRGAELYLDMIFRHRFYHADPHPGNIWVLPGGVLGLLDCGMVGQVDGRTLEVVEGLILAAVEKDSSQITDFLVRIGSRAGDFNRDDLESEINELVGEVAGASLKEFDLSAALNGMMDIIRRYHIILPTGVSMLVKVLVMLEGTSRRLNRDFNVAELLKPYYRDAIKRRFSPERILQRLRRSYRDWDRLIDVFPREIVDILVRIREGRFDVQLEHHRLEPTVNRLVYGILAAALFLGSCMLVSREIPPAIAGVSVPGGMGCGLAVLLGIRLLRAIKKSGDLSQR